MSRGQGERGEREPRGLFMGDRLPQKDEEKTHNEEEEEEDEDEGEEARPIIVARDPGCPTEAQRKAHEASHLPFRIWCAECVGGRLDNPPHKKVPEEERGVPEFLMDYAFLKDEGDTQSLTVLVSKDRDSRIVMGNVVLVKGRGMGETVEQACNNIKRLGNQPKRIIKTDNEPALIDLRNAVMETTPGAMIPNKPPKGESQSNGAVENGVKLIKGMIRVYKLALNRRLDGNIPTHHPVMAWLVEHAGEMLSKYMVGKDGKTGYERLFGKTVKEEIIEFGEQVWYRRRKGESKDLQSRWLPGTWLGKRWGSIDHLVFAKNEVVEARAVQRRPEAERWSGRR